MMILQSEYRVVSNKDSRASVLDDEQKGVMRLEFKAIDLSANSEINDVYSKPEAVDAIPLAEEEILPSGKNEHDLSEELDAARQAGRSEGREEVEGECERRIAEERMKVLRLSELFHREKERYFGAVEAEVVKLALAIAARVLNREAKLDPIMLQAVVKIALNKVREGGGAVLRVPMSDLPLWRELMLRDETAAIEVTGDARLERGNCVLDTRVGKVELGVSAQLEEIERGFFDLLQQRPV